MLDKIKRTYAYIDIIGTKEILKQDKVFDVLAEFWNESDALINTDSILASEYYQIDGKNADCRPYVYLRTFSDLAILYTEPELVICDFYKIIEFYRDKIDKLGLKTYCIINRGEEYISTSSAHSVDNNTIPCYLQITGVGDAQTNIYWADKSIPKKWKEKYYFYAVGKLSLCDKYQVSAQTNFKNITGNEVNLFAISESLIEGDKC